MGESRYLHRSHNVSVLLSQVVCAAKYRRVVFRDRVDAVLREACLEIAKRYGIVFLEIGTDRNHVHFLIQSVPTYSPTKIVRTVKQPNTTARLHFVLISPATSGSGEIDEQERATPTSPPAGECPTE